MPVRARNRYSTAVANRMARAIGNPRAARAIAQPPPPRSRIREIIRTRRARVPHLVARHGSNHRSGRGRDPQNVDRSPALDARRSQSCEIREPLEIITAGAVGTFTVTGTEPIARRSCTDPLCLSHPSPHIIRSDRSSTRDRRLIALERRAHLGHQRCKLWGEISDETPDWQRDFCGW